MDYSENTNDLLWERIADEVDDRIEAGTLPKETAGIMSTMSLEEALETLQWPQEPDTDAEIKDEEVMKE